MVKPETHCPRCTWLEKRRVDAGRGRGRNDRQAERRKRGDLQAEVTASRSQSPHKSEVRRNGAAKLAIVWHRRETRRQTEKTNSQLRWRSGVYESPW